MDTIAQQILLCLVARRRPKHNGLYGGDFDHATFEIPSWWLWLRRSAAGTSVWAQEWQGGGQNLKNAPRKTRGVNVLVFESFVKWTNDLRRCTIMFLWDSKFWDEESLCGRGIANTWPLLNSGSPAACLQWDWLIFEHFALTSSHFVPMRQGPLRELIT